MIKNSKVFIWNHFFENLFYKLLPIDKRICLDLEPKYEGIRQLNFFDFKPEKDKKYFAAAYERINKARIIKDDYLDTIQRCILRIRLELN